MEQKSDLRDMGKVGSHRPLQRVSNAAVPIHEAQALQDYVERGDAPAEDSGSLEIIQHMLGRILRRIRLVVIVALLIASLGVLCAYQQPNVFESSAEVNLLPEATSSAAIEESSGSGAQNAAHVTTEMRLLSSHRLIDRFVDGLQPGYSFQFSTTHPSLSGILAFWPESIKATIFRVAERNLRHDEIEKGPNRGLREEVGNREDKRDLLNRKSIAGALHQALNVRFPHGLGPKDGIVEVCLRANRPEAAQKVLQSYLAFYGQVAHDRLRSELATQRAALEEQYAKAEEKWLQSERNLADFAHTSGIVPGTDNILVPSVNLVNKALERIVKAREEKARIRSLEDTDTESKTAGLEKISEHRFLTGLRQQLETLQSQYAGWKTVYSADAPKMIQLERTINYLRAKVNEATEQAADQAFESATREEKVLKHTLDEARKDAERMNVLQCQYAVLKRKAEIDNRACQKVLNALGDLDIRSATISSGVTIIEPPTLPSVPVAPKRGLIVTIGITLGLLCGVAVACVAENMVSSLRVVDIEKMAAEINTRTLGLVPDFSTFNNNAGQSKNRSELPIAPSDAARNPVMHVIRAIETSIFFLGSEERSRITLISSAISQEGKTFFAASLSRAMSAREGQKTLVIDADMRRPRLHEVFGHKDMGPGLSTLLTEKTSTLSQVVRRSQVPGLWYLTAGPVPPDPLALLRSQWFRQVLRTLERYFNNIVIDSPPVLSVPDYMPLCHLVKRVILVVRQGETLREEVRKSAELIRSVPDTCILGVVLNRAEMSAGRYRSSLSHHSRHHYRYYERYYDKVS